VISDSFTVASVRVKSMAFIVIPWKQVSKQTEQNLMIDLHIAYKLQKTSRI